MLTDEAWFESAACKGEDPNRFFPERGEDVQRIVLEFCANCPVRQACLTYALKEQILSGIWGGLSERARRRLRHQHHVVSIPCAECGKVFGFELGRKLRTYHCSDPCRQAHRRRTHNLATAKSQARKNAQRAQERESA